MTQMGELYRQYGQAMIQLEIANGRVQELKARIAQEMNRPVMPEKKEKI